MGISRIPMPQNGIDAFVTGMQNSQKMFDSMMNNRNQAARANLAQQEADRQQKLLPYLMQQYKDAHDLSPLQRQHLAAQITEATASAQKAQSDLRFNNWVDNQVMGTGNDKVSPGIQPTETASSSTMPTPQETTGNGSQNSNPMNLSRHESVSIANQDQAASDAARNQSNSAPSITGAQPPSPLPAIAPQEPTAPPQPVVSPPQQAPAPSKQTIGEEITVRPATPGKEWMDKLAGVTAHGHTFKEAKELTPVDGIQQTVWPSGRITQRKVGPNAEEKAAINLNAAEQKEEAKITAKKAQDLRDAGYTLNKYSEHTDELYKLFKKGFQTGPGTAVKTWLGGGAENEGVFTENSVPLIGELGKELSNRGGAVVSRMASAAKPAMRNGTQQNVAIIDQLRKQQYQTYNDLKKQYEDIKHEPYPVPRPKYFDNVKVVSPKGHMIEASPEEAKKILAEFPGSKIIGKAYE